MLAATLRTREVFQFPVRERLGHNRLGDSVHPRAIAAPVCFFMFAQFQTMNGLCVVAGLVHDPLAQAGKAVF